MISSLLKLVWFYLGIWFDSVRLSLEMELLFLVSIKLKQN